MFMGWIADVSTMALGFIVPLFCFGFIVYFGLNGYKVKKTVQA
jgi:FHS family L-fucose permease-like MFS transporter